MRISSIFSFVKRCSLTTLDIIRVRQSIGNEHIAKSTFQIEGGSLETVDVLLPEAAGLTLSLLLGDQISVSRYYSLREQDPFSLCTLR